MSRQALSGVKIKVMIAGLAMIALTTKAIASGSDPSWTVLPFITRGVDTNASNTFRDLLSNELGRRVKAQFVPPPQGYVGCADATCARKAGLAAPAHFVLFGSLSALGSKVIATVTMLDVIQNKTVNSQTLSVAKVEELDKAAERIATALAQGTTSPATATGELGTITPQEAQPDLRLPATRGGQFRVGTMFPLGDGYAGAQDVGVLFDLSYWFEARDFALEPRVGLRFDAVHSDNSYAEVPIDIGVYYILGNNSLALVAGGGAGVHHLWETRGTTTTVGEVLPSRITRLKSDSGWGFGAYGRVGMILGRNYTARVMITAEYQVTVIELNDFTNPTALSVGLSIIY